MKPFAEFPIDDSPRWAVVNRDFSCSVLERACVKGPSRLLGLLLITWILVAMPGAMTIGPAERNDHPEFGRRGEGIQKLDPGDPDHFAGTSHDLSSPRGRRPTVARAPTGK